MSRLATCAGCDRPATTEDEAGVALCAACLAGCEAEADANPIEADPVYEQGYEDGFADAINDVVPDLLAAVAAVLRNPTTQDVIRLGRPDSPLLLLQGAFNACKRVAA